VFEVSSDLLELSDQRQLDLPSGDN
jgi:hypothetical protein